MFLSEVCSPLWSIEKYVKECTQRVVFTISNYSLGQKYCRRCEVYMYNQSAFCPCCGIQLRLTPSSRKCKEILRKRKSTIV
jgi:hypothetical protein